MCERRGLRLGHLRQIDGAPGAGGDPLELLAHLRADAEAEGVEIVGLLDAVVQDDDLGALLLVEDQLAQRIAVERRQEQVADADVELDDLDLGLAGGLGGGLVVLDEQGSDEAAAEIGERQALRLEAVVALAHADHEVHEGEVGIAAVDRERRDAGADDDGEGEESLADDLAQRLEGADPLPDALEPSVGADGVEVEFTHGGVGHGGRRSPTVSEAGAITASAGTRA
jgi:hypothetical protein